MPELFQEMYYGPNVQNLVESDDCKVMRLSDNSGEGMMTLYHVFPGVFLMYNDFHMKECVSGFQTDMDLLCIDHCREGRIEQEVGQNAGKGALSRRSVKMPLAIWRLAIFEWIAASIIPARWNFHFLTTTAFPLAFRWRLRQRKSQSL